MSDKLEICPICHGSSGHTLSCMHNRSTLPKCDTLSLACILGKWNMETQQIKGGFA